MPSSLRELGIPAELLHTAFVHIPSPKILAVSGLAPRFKDWRSDQKDHRRSVISGDCYDSQCPYRQLCCRWVQESYDHPQLPAAVSQVRDRFSFFSLGLRSDLGDLLGGVDGADAERLLPLGDSLRSPQN